MKTTERAAGRPCLAPPGKIVVGLTGPIASGKSLALKFGHRKSFFGIGNIDEVIRNKRLLRFAHR